MTKQLSNTRKMSAASLQAGQSIRLTPWHRATGYDVHTIRQIRRGTDGVQITTETGRTLRFGHGELIDLVL